MSDCQVRAITPNKIAPTLRPTHQKFLLPADFARMNKPSFLMGIVADGDSVSEKRDLGPAGARSSRHFDKVCMHMLNLAGVA